MRDISTVNYEGYEAMTGTDIGLLKAATRKMHWHETRQKVIAENVANADTPNYQPKDLKPLKFKEMLQKTSSSLLKPPAITNSKHLTSTITSRSDSKFNAPKTESSYDTSPTGNSVNLEEQLMKMSNNQLDHRLTTTIYKKTVDALKKSTQSR